MLLLSVPLHFGPLEGARDLGATALALSYR